MKNDSHVVKIQTWRNKLHSPYHLDKRDVLFSTGHLGEDRMEWVEVSSLKLTHIIEEVLTWKLGLEHVSMAVTCCKSIKDKI